MLKQTRLGNSNRQVTAIGLGAMPLSLTGRPDEHDAIRVIGAFIEHGGNFIDTANVYCRDDREVGHNERLINKALKDLHDKHRIIVATKGGLRRPRGGWEVDASPDWLRLSCEQSLKDLGQDSIFLYQLHAPDPEVPLTDSVGELSRLRQEGKIRHVGLSNVTVEEIETAMNVVPITSVQNRCNILQRKSFTSGVVEFCHQNEISFIAHSPVGGHFDHGKLASNRILNRLGNAHQTTPYQIALAWLLACGDHILPIPGASKVTSITSSLNAMNIELAKNELEALDTL
jgi:aryl-alcohol dehydrogenase-like predicted oxidoreductase